MEALKISIDVNVNLDFTSRMAALFTQMMETASTSQKVVPSETSVPAIESTTPVLPVKEEKAVAPAEEVKPAPKVAEPATAEEARAVEEAKRTAEVYKKSFSAEDVRRVMHEIRLHIEGDDYKENREGEKYKKYHKALSEQFKHIAALYGAEKPSLLPDDDARNKFIRHCEMLEVDSKGEIYCATDPF